MLLKWTDSYEFTQLRGLFAICKKKFVMSEKHSDNGIYEPDKHFVEFSDFSECKEWLNKDRKEFSVEAYNDLKENHSFTKYLGIALKGII